MRPAREHEEQPANGGPASGVQLHIVNNLKHQMIGTTVNIYILFASPIPRSGSTTPV